MTTGMSDDDIAAFERLAEHFDDDVGDAFSQIARSLKLDRDQCDSGGSKKRRE